MRKLSKVILFSQLGNYFSPVRKVIFDAFLSRKASLRISNRQVCDGGLPIIPHNSFQMRSGYMNLALLTCVSRTGKIIGTMGRAWILMPVRAKMALFSFIFPCFSTFGAVFFETSYFIFTFSFLGKQLIISLLEKKLSDLLSQFQLSQLFLRGLCVFIFSIFIILYIYYNYIYIK